MKTSYRVAFVSLFTFSLFGAPASFAQSPFCLKVLTFLFIGDRQTAEELYYNEKYAKQRQVAIDKKNELARRRKERERLIPSPRPPRSDEEIMRNIMGASAPLPISLPAKTTSGNPHP
jgi:hypothetical protein